MKLCLGPNLIVFSLTDPQQTNLLLREREREKEREKEKETLNVRTQTNPIKSRKVLQLQKRSERSILTERGFF